MPAQRSIDREHLRGQTAPGLLCERARREPRRIAFRSKHLGLYRERTWEDYARLVAAWARALQFLGLVKGDRIAIMGDACEEWVLADLGAQSLGVIVYGIYPTASAAEVEHQMRDGGAKVLIAENQEYVDKILAIADDLPTLEHIVVIDDTALFAYAHDKLRSAHRLLGPEGMGDIAYLEKLVSRLQPEDPAFIIYTSGTTGHPKGALITHGKHLAATATVSDHYPMLYDGEHRTVIYLPLCHVLGRDVAVTLPLFTGLVPHFGEDPEDLATTMFEVAPTVLFTVPRYLQRYAASVLVGISGSSWLKRKSHAAAMALARRHVRRRWEGRRELLGGLSYRLARRLVLRPILVKLGFDRLRLAISGGAPLPAETMALWHMLGVNLCEMYGQTETAGGIISGQQGPFPRPGSVGTPVEGWTVTLADDGEILVGAPDLFEGYWNDKDASAAVRTADGLLRTGDVGEWHGKDLRLIDRARDFIVTQGGKTISPAFVENILRASPYIAEAMVIGHGRKYLAALIEIEQDTVADWARSNDIAYTGFTSLAANPRVVELIKTAIDEANVELARVEQIKTFRILPKALDPEEEGEPVTPTRKVKRNLMAERFGDLVAAMYDDREERLIAGEVGAALENIN
jgi:long-chain acyl-CoA synthetase